MMQDYYFGNLMLGKLDVLAGQLGLERAARTPRRSTRTSSTTSPPSSSTQDGTVKYFFKKAISGILPDSIIYRPKQGFRTPVVELFAGELGDWGESMLLDGGLTKLGFLQRAPLAELLRDHRTGRAGRQHATVDGADAEPVAPALDRVGQERQGGARAGD